MSNVKQDSEIHSPTAWVRDLVAAGWAQVNHLVYRDPEGNLWRGPFGAWRELQRREAVAIQTADHRKGREGEG